MMIVVIESDNRQLRGTNIYIYLVS